ncbi:MULTISPECIES: acyl carrier protein [Dictyoglomus]|jgi:acyl carrier protein|uniref:Acyl carrier protein n=1 Tax=Dictyoglomus turgidum (strain DSM 6724 / Z-1310) TaxID=515635 RepID=B8E197_DICTD|nr:MULTISPECIES: acyl carrier protein [Dictyoglomus]ACK42225.1 acyl carrier protein [Dictyoglomus turgidum DSM 6724]PNV79843.1 MAG: acyl carrier protein [Dictyoglomus turgidum]HBU32455.1 acyl carrier protein [Dictyoglomus sp.]
MDESTIFEKVKKIIVDQLRVDENLVTMDSNIQEDLGADSLDAVELIMALEEEFGIDVQDEEAENFKTVGDVVRYIEKRL